MTTLAAPFIANGVVSAWEQEYPSASFSGIVGDAAHQARGGYHISIEDQSSSNYSVVRPDDKAPPGTWSRRHATALDMSMNKADMVKCTRRMMVVWSDRTDPRRQYFNGFNAWTGSGDAQRWDYVTNTVQKSTNDHQWHVHKELRRKYYDVPKAFRALISIIRGETKEQWLASEAGRGDDDMFCKYGDGNNGTPSDAVIAVQELLLQLDPKALPQFGADGGYGDETAKAMSRLVTGGDGKVYGGRAYAKLRKLTEQKNGGGGASGLIPHTHDVPGLTFSGTVTGTTPATPTGPAKAS